MGWDVVVLHHSCHDEDSQECLSLSYACCPVRYCLVLIAILLHGDEIIRVDHDLRHHLVHHEQLKELYW